MEMGIVINGLAMTVRNSKDLSLAIRKMITKIEGDYPEGFHNLPPLENSRESLSDFYDLTPEGF